MRDRLGTIATAFVLALVLAVGVWPSSGWTNEWTNDGECLGWYVTEWAGGIYSEVEGPYVVARKWCQ